MTNDPHKNVQSFSYPALGPTAGRNNFVTSGNSPITNTNGTRITELKRFVYQARCSALPLTTTNDLLITTERRAVMTEDINPNEIPTMDIGTASSKTPTKNPRVTTEHAISMERDGRT